MVFNYFAQAGDHFDVIGGETPIDVYVAVLSQLDAGAPAGHHHFASVPVVISLGSPDSTSPAIAFTCSP